jgi:NAD(P)-dependent dehydrogenase (short-subunit alcohol dehydrogenase family)
MRIDLAARTAFVTDSTGGIGFAIARGLAKSGAAHAPGGSFREKAEVVRRLLISVLGDPVR